jgi:hypothetical protein
MAASPTQGEAVPSYAQQLALPAWWLVDAEGKVVASVRAETALEARDVFRREGQSGARVVRAQVAPVDEQANPGPVCATCGDSIREEADYREVTGRERITRNGAGGTNALRCPDRSAEVFYCKLCTDRAASGVSPHQQALV